MDPRVVPHSRFSDWRVYTPSNSWLVPLLVSPLQLRSEARVVNFDFAAIYKKEPGTQTTEC